FIVSIGVLSLISLGAVGQFIIFNILDIPIQVCLLAFSTMAISSVISGFVIEKIKRKRLFFFSYSIWGICMMLIAIFMLFPAIKLPFYLIFLLIIVITSSINVTFGISYVNSYLRMEHRGGSLGFYVGLGILFFGLVTGAWILDREGKYTLFILGGLNFMVGIASYFNSKKIGGEIVLNNPIKIPKYIEIKANLIAYYIGSLVFGLFLGIVLVSLVSNEMMLSFTSVENVDYFKNFSVFQEIAAAFGLPLYVFTFAVAGFTSPIFSIIFGKLIDKYGRKRIFLTANVLISIDLLFFSMATHIVFIILFALCLAMIAGIYFQIIYIIWPDLAPEGKLARYVGIGFSSLVFGVFIGMGYIFFIIAQAIDPAKQLNLLILINNAVAMVSFIPFFFMKETLPPEEELFWQNEIINIHVIHKGGVIMSYYSFIFEEGVREGEEERDPLLFSSGITGISTFLQEVVESKERVENIDHQDKKLMFEYGNNFTVVLLTKRILKILRNKLHLLANDIQELLGSVIESWNGDLDSVQPIKSLIVRFFVNN
ncbi:MAG: MFS transporter, partial [Candidatus Hodarchaeota archaeon]